MCPCDERGKNFDRSKEGSSALSMIRSQSSSFTESQFKASGVRSADNDVSDVASTKYTRVVGNLDTFNQRIIFSIEATHFSSNSHANFSAIWVFPNPPMPVNTVIGRLRC